MASPVLVCAECLLLSKLCHEKKKKYAGYRIHKSLVPTSICERQLVPRRILVSFPQFGASTEEVL